MKNPACVAAVSRDAEKGARAIGHSAMTFRSIVFGAVLLMPLPSGAPRLTVLHAPALTETDCVAEDAVRSETFSRRDLPAICDLQGDFRKLQGEPAMAFQVS
jgi:hypothetical protein